MIKERSSMWGNSKRSREKFTRQIVIAGLFVVILIAVDVIAIFGVLGIIARPAPGVFWLVALHLIFTMAMLIWAMNLKSEWEHIDYHTALHNSFKEELLEARDQDKVVDVIFKYVRLGLPVTGGSLHLEPLPGDKDVGSKQEWFRDYENIASTGENGIPPCQQCISRRAGLYERVTHLIAGGNNKSNGEQSATICRWVSVKERRLARICLNLNGGDELSELQGDYVQGLIMDSLPAFQWAKMRDLTSRSGKSGEIERIQLAHYLHDTLVNDLAYLNIKIEQIQALNDSNDGSGLQSDLHVVGKIANRSYQQVRDELFRLRESPPSDFIFALKQTVDQVSSRADFKIDFVMQGQTQPLSAEVNRNLLYIVREALRNVEKHANAEHVDVVMKWEPESLRVQISDNGRGFSPAAVKKEKKHFGLGILQECADEIKAELEINSVANGGTQVTLLLPL